jgi:hypothetical protein
MPRNALIDGLRIFERGIDQHIKIEILDVERLAHMGAAVLQELRDLGLIVGVIELGLDRVRSRRDLRERKRRGEQLDQNQIHRDFNVIMRPRSTKKFVVAFGAARQQRRESPCDLISLTLTTPRAARGCGGRVVCVVRPTVRAERTD